MTEPFRLTSLAHGGGCGCKISPKVLQTMLQDQPEFGPFEGLVVGSETCDDAAVYALDHETCIIATTDFFMPMVDDAETFGQIAAANAISDIYAMGGKPIMALAILGVPVDKMPPSLVAAILRGGREKAAEAGIAVAGGHSIDCPEPVYGLAVIGVAKKHALRQNCAARIGDKLVILKGIGVGIYSAAFKKNQLDAPSYQEMVASMTQLNDIGMQFAQWPEVHAMTDVTGFGILGHSLEMAQGSKATLVVNYHALPLLEQAEHLAQQGCVTGASKRNWASYGDNIVLAETVQDYERSVLTDPQTSGGLLLAVAPQRADELVEVARSQGFQRAAVIGEVRHGAPCVKVLKV